MGRAGPSRGGWPMTPPRVIAIDPGGVGACVELGSDGVTPHAALEWRPLRRKGGTVYRVRGWRLGRPTGMLVHESLRWCMRWSQPWLHPDAGVVGVVEGLRPHRATGKESYGKLNDAAGMQLGMLCGSLDKVYRPHATAWRFTMLGLGPRVKAKVCSAYAVKMAPLVMALGEMPEDMRTNEHVCEALWMARWGWIQERRSR